LQTRAVARAKSAFISMNDMDVTAIDAAADARKHTGRSEQFAEDAEAGEDQNDQRPGHGTV
jgi:hypothetical protein